MGHQNRWTNNSQKGILESELEKNKFGEEDENDEDDEVDRVNVEIYIARQTKYMFFYVQIKCKLLGINANIYFNYIYRKMCYS
jgi:hypothetical protein